VSRRARLLLFAAAGPGLAAVMLIGLGGLPPFGDYHGIYGLLLAKTEVSLRRATDIVTALNFDIRAFDTLGEEFILFASVAGVALLLRRLRGEHQEHRARGIEDHRFAGASEGLRLASLIMIPLIVALGVYIIVHGQLTPGGGFQGGIVLAAAPVAILLGGRYLTLKRIAPEWALEGLDAFGAMAYVLIGLGGLIFAGTFFKNFLPFGDAGQLLSAGTMPLNSVAVGLEVTGAFLLVWTEFLDQTLISAGPEAEKG